MTVEYYDRNEKIDIETKGRYETVLEVSDEDTFSAALGQNFSCCLNFASAESPGGGYKSILDLMVPCKNQEEDLFRKSNLPDIMDVSWVRKKYPLEDIDCFFCECLVTKDMALNDIYPFVTGVITMPAVIEPKPYEQTLVRRKIYRILEIAAHQFFPVLILGAWGCGVFGNDPRQIATDFKEMIELDFKGCFEKVIFAIPNENSINHKIFKEVIIGN